MREDASHLKALVQTLPQPTGMKLATVGDEGDVGPLEVTEDAHEDLSHEALTVGETGEQRILGLVAEPTALTKTCGNGKHVINANVFDKQTDLSLSINNELTKVNDWLRVNKLSLNVNKSKAMVFHMPQKKVSLPQLNMAGMAIEFVSNFNFLGIKIDTNLNWLSHTNLVANTILKTAGVLNKLKDILPQSVLTTIYFSLI